MEPVQQDPSSPPTSGSQSSLPAPLYPPATQHNVRILSSLSTLVACFSGAVAGILGLTNSFGFILYLLASIFSALTVGLLKCKGDVGKYVAQAHAVSQPGHAGRGGRGVKTWRGWVALLGIGQENALGFLLFWIGGYALIHVYD